MDPSLKGQSEGQVSLASAASSWSQSEPQTVGLGCEAGFQGNPETSRCHPGDLVPPLGPGSPSSSLMGLPEPPQLMMSPVIQAEV